MSPFAKIILSALIVLMAIVIVAAIRAKKKKSRNKIILYLFIFAVFFTTNSLFWTKDIAYDTETIAHLEFGWPIQFVIQDQRYFNPPFPYPMRADFGGTSNGTVFIWENFISSTIINFIFAAVVWRLVMAAMARWHRK